MKILIVDDHEIVTYGVKKFIQEYHPEYMISTSADAAFLDFGLKDRPDLVILDVEYPEMDVFEIIRRIRSKWIKCSIIIYTIHQEAGLLRRLLDAGVDDIVLKSSSIDMLLRSIESVAKGECPPKCLKITPKQRFLLYETTLKYIQKIKNWNSYLLKSVRDNQSLFEEKQ